MVLQIGIGSDAFGHNLSSQFLKFLINSETEFGMSFSHFTRQFRNFHVMYKMCSNSNKDTSLGISNCKLLSSDDRWQCFCPCFCAFCSVQLCIWKWSFVLRKLRFALYKERFFTVDIYKTKVDWELQELLHQNAKCVRQTVVPSNNLLCISASAFLNLKM